MFWYGWMCLSLLCVHICIFVSIWYISHSPAHITHANEAWRYDYVSQLFSCFLSGIAWRAVSGALQAFANLRYFFLCYVIYCIYTLNVITVDCTLLSAIKAILESHFSWIYVTVCHKAGSSLSLIDNLDIKLSLQVLANLFLWVLDLLFWPFYLLSH